MALIPMLKILFIYLALLVFHWSPSKAAGLIERSATHYGKQFVLGFTAQTESMFHTGYNEILISAPLDTYVTISLHKSHRRESILKNRFVKAGNILKYRLSTSARMHSTMKQNLGILVEASADVAVSCLNQGRYTADSYLALPVNVLGKKYVVASYAKSNVGIIAPQDNTTVYIMAKDIVRYRGRSYRKGENITIKLNKLQSFHLDHRSDLSGTIIRANKPIAVLSGDKCAKTNTKYCDHLVEFLLPFENWGRKFVVATTGKMDKNTGDMFRVFAYESDTRVRSKDGDRMLKSGQFAEYRFGRQELSSFFECSKPCSVIQYTTGYLNNKRREVDSSMIVVPSVHHYPNSYEIPLSGGQKYFYRHSVTLVIKTSERNGLILNGKNATHLRWQNVDATKYSWTIFQMSSETAITHISQEASFSVLAFGEADFQSHGHPGGFNFLIKKSAICKKISSINNGEVISNGMLEGDEISFVCDPNYVLVGEKVLRCLSTGEWNASEPQCEEQCPDPSESTNAIVKGNDFYHGKKVEFACTKDEVLTPEISRKLTCEYGTWNGVIPSCKASCPYFKQMQNGVVSGAKRTHGSTIQFKCNDGYQQIGAFSATCEDGKWSETLPRCLAPCSVLSGISNGVVNGKTRTHGSIIQFKCNDGYQLIGASRVTCEDGKWSETLPRCLAVCKKISSINNGMVIGNGNVEGDEIEFLCYENYTLVGDHVLRCTDKGRWNTSQPKCEETCPDPRRETNARVIGNEFYNGKEVEFICSNDYVIIPEYSKKLKCENGKWKGEIPFCKASCPILPEISKGVVNATERTHGSIIQFKCNDGYQLSDASSTTCEDGKWSETLPQCLAICRKILSIGNGQVIGNGNVEGDEIEFRCSTNYTLVGDQVLRCTNKGRWNTSQPKCKASCPVLSELSNGVVNGTKRTHGSIIQFKCNSGYQLIGASSATCEDGKWSETLPRCLVTCPDPRTQTNARVIGNEFDNEKEVEFTCSDDYVLIPEYSRKLKCENGKWKGVIPLCKAPCPPLSKISKGVVKGTKRTHGSMIQFKCNYRYQLIGASSATCEDGKWSKTLPRCAAICRKIFAIKNGKVIGSGTLEGDKIRFACNENYLLIGEQVLECKSDGGWNASEPKCKVPASWSRWEGWSDCSVSCNNGTQTRKRTCVGTISSQKEEKRCHGKSKENRTCATWKCPDCNKHCETGKLNIDCDTCICDDNILTGVVKDNGGVLLDNATIALSESPFKILARSNLTGKFVVNGMCISEDSIIVSRDGYIPQKIKTTKINPTTARVTAILKRIVFPEVTGHPQSKLRLEGQPMTLCCESKSSTSVRFEWVINGRAADEYQHDELKSSKLVIPQISRNMSGEIKCRVYNDHGAEFSDPANITVLSSTDDSCEPTPSVRIIKLPPGCSYEGRNSIDVGQCHKSKCIARGLNNISNCEENFCCQPKTTKKIKIKCKSIYFNMTQVTQCGCGDCLPRQTIVKGVARGGADNIPFKYGYIYHGDKYLTRTGRKGEFYFKIPGHFSRLVVTFKDKRGYNNFQDLTKVIALIPGRKTYVEARMKERPKPITVNAKEGFEIPLGSLATSKRPNEAANDTDSSKRSNPAVALSLPPQSLVTEDGTIYDGQAKVEISFVDPRNATEVEEVGGDFTTVSEDGEQQLLETFGVIKMEFRDVNDKRLQPNSDINVLLDLDEYNITEKEAENIKLWYMDVKTGRWRIMDQGLKPHETRRSRRSGRKFYYGKIDNKLYQRDVNLDAWADTCLFKVKFDDFGIEDFNTVDLTVLTTKGNLNRYQTEGVDANSAACMHTYCAGNEAIIRATLNGEFLIPNETEIYSDVNNIEYYRSSDVTDRFSNRITIKELTQPLGHIPSPFYSNKISCKNSPADYSFTFNMPKISEDVDLIEHFEENWYPDPVFAKTCFVKILVDDINRCPNKTIYFVVQSVLGENQAPAGHVVLRLTESKSTACAEYKCPERNNHGIRVNVTALAEGYFIENHEATQEFITEMTSTVSDDFSFEPEFDIRKPSIGIIQSEKAVFLDEEKEERIQDCMNERIKAGIRFRCSIPPLFPLPEILWEIPEIQLP